MTALRQATGLPFTTALAYERISDDKRHEALGVQRQAEANEAEATGYSVAVAEHYIDNSTSATKKGVVRRDWQRLLRDIRSGRWDGQLLVCYAVDRLLREPREMDTLIELAD